ncbi:hypothetical protein [Paenibacillus xylaniclasticus]|uniref:hypothetical protein n=1 Tax=Paenibacillus xylaniclasticus TaxID=588083 RepID=UPI000FDA42F1|nr:MULTISPECIES: hypothetical protein [Paenibacillus]GFN33842.1 hypothetical protein PCURB6_41020 [Paenibacillus curdlanolyticus]
MRMPYFDRFVRYVRYCFFMLMGAIIGAAVYHSIFMSSYDKVAQLNYDLQEQLEQSSRDIELLNKYKHQHTVIKSIVPIILKEEEPLNELAEAELKKRLKEDLSVFIGTSIYQIDDNAEFASKLLKDKIYVGVRGSDYRITIRTVLVADNVLQVWVRVVKYERPPA